MIKNAYLPKIFLFVILSLGLNAFAQTMEQKKIITSDYDNLKLTELQAQFQLKATSEKQAALQYARQKGIEPILYLPDGGYAELQRIEADGSLIYYRTLNVNASASTRTNLVNIGGSLGLSLDGQNMIAHIWDAGLARSTHQEYDGPGGINRFSIGDGTTVLHYHSAHVTGTIIASGYVASAKGMAPQASAIGYDWNSDLSEATGAAQNGMLISNHSYGYNSSYVSDYYFGGYITDSRDWDELHYNAPYYLMVVAAGNDGATNYNGAPLNPSYPQYDKLTGHCTSKNNMVVANAVDASVDASGNLLSPVSINSSSSQGPTDDLRIKPDITGNGTGLYSTYETADNAYASITGTSMASPNIAGSLLLLQQHAFNVRGSYLRSATLKGVALHTADDAGMTGPDAIHGWGLMNTKRAAEAISQNDNQSIVDELTLTPGQTYVVDVESDGVNELIASICWTDPPGVATTELNSPDARLINDLDIRVIKNSVTYYPWKLTGVNTNGLGDNTKDNYERINITGATGSYTVTVSHKGSLTGGSQNFSLIITGLSPIPVMCNATVPTGLAVSNIGSSTATVSWNPVPAATYDVQYRQTGAQNWTTIAVTGSSTLLTGLTQLTQYEVQVRSKCPDNTTSAYSAPVSFTTTEVQINYCASASTNTQDEYIGRVQLNTINNASGAQYYSNFTNISTDLTKGQTYTLTVTPTWTATVYNEGYAAWIDYNKDGDFDDAGEQIWSRAATTASPVSGSFTVPAGAVDGSTRLRVSMKYSAIPAACETFTYGEVEDYTVIMGAGQPDTEPPTAPANLAASNITQTSVDLSWTASTDNVGVTGYDVYKDGILWGTVTSTIATVTGLSPETQYSFYVIAKDAAGNISPSSNVVTATTLPVVVTYCSSGGTSAAYEWIQRVVLGNIDNPSSNNGGYYDYTGLSTILTISTGNTITITPGRTNNSRREAYRVWIDYNQDRDFDDAGELVFNQPKTTAAYVSGSFTAPSTALLGATRMRISMKYNASPGTCEIFTFGEVEDYTVIIDEAQPDTEPPTAPANLAASNITQTSVDLSWTASTDNVGVTGYEVYKDGILWGTVTTTIATVTGLIAETSYDFYVKARDAAGNISPSSNAVTVTTLPAVDTYCTSKGTNTAYEWIDGVVLGSIVNTLLNLNDGGYGDYTNLSTILTIGQSNTITITPWRTSSSRKEAYRVWIDYDQDGNFDDAGELVFNQPKTTAASVNGSFTVPSGASPGGTRMRVSMKYNASPGTCETFTYGEVEDYTVNISNTGGQNYEAPPFEQSSDELVVYPNPVNDGKLNLRLNKVEATGIRIFSMYGQLLIDKTFNEIIDISGLPAGTFIIEVITKEKTLNKLFIKQ